MRRWIVVAGVLLGAGVGGCATTLRGERQELKIRTDPPGATVHVDGQQYTAPVTVRLLRKESYDVLVEAPGHRAVRFRWEAQWDGASLGNMLYPGGSIGLATDTASGADRAFYPIATIALPRSDDPAAPPLVLKQRRGRLMTEEEYREAEAREKAENSRFFGQEQ